MDAPTRAVELRVRPREEAAAELADELERLFGSARRSGPGEGPAPSGGSAEAALAGGRPPGGEGREPQGPSLVLGVATGATMEPIYAELGRRCRAGRASFGRVRAFALDEYCGLEPDDPGRMRAELTRTLLERVDLPPEQVAFPDVDGGGGPDGLEARCDAYERALREAGGVDLQLLGVGANGHVAFNEPGSAPDSRTRRVHLAAGTREAAAERFGGLDRVPTAALTQGLGTIRRARRLRLFAFGARKGPAVAALLSARRDPGWPVTQLLGHPDLVVWVDPELAAAIGRG